MTTAHQIFEDILNNFSKPSAKNRGRALAERIYSAEIAGLDRSTAQEIAAELIDMSFHEFTITHVPVGYTRDESVIAYDELCNILTANFVFEQRTEMISGHQYIVAY
jgi:hypothetical protein